MMVIVFYSAVIAASQANTDSINGIKSELKMVIQVKRYSKSETDVQSVFYLREEMHQMKCG